MDMLNKNLNSMATEEKDINDQKAKLQGEAQMGEEAAEIAAKLPVSPETVIEGIMFARKASEYKTHLSSNYCGVQRRPLTSSCLQERRWRPISCLSWASWRS